ncbi:MAG TPA: hypothetical protein VMY05_03025 [Acidobacteriota bacterium]|nr:hypothetical protein [Acidobacteriota bacterium]
MSNPSEKAYRLALQALKRKDYRTAADLFAKAAPGYQQDREFALLRESTRLLLAVQRELTALKEADEELEIEEVFSNGQETDVC